MPQTKTCNEVEMVFCEAETECLHVIDELKLSRASSRIRMLKSE